MAVLLVSLPSLADDKIKSQWENAVPIKDEEDIIGVWIYKESPTSKTELRYLFSDKNKGNYSVVTKSGEATGIPIQYKIFNAKLYLRANTLNNLQDGEWPYIYEIQKFDRSLFIMDRNKIKEFKKLGN